MIHPDASPIAHISPYKRIELGSRDRKPEPKWVPVAAPVPSGGWAMQPGYMFPIESDQAEGLDIFCG